MSQQETRIGKIKLIEKLDNEALDEQCKRVFGNGKYESYYDSYEEALRDCDDKYIIHNNNVYEVVEDVKNYGEDIYCAIDNGDGTISYVLSYYNGGCGFTEAIQESLDNIKR